MSRIKDTLKPKQQGTYRQGYYKLRHPNKYIGDPTKIIFRSSWELRFCKFCDDNEAILRWSSEPLGIKYICPIEELKTPGIQKQRTYYVDFYMRAIRDGVERDYLVEVKPESSLHKPVFEGKATHKRLMQFNKAAETWITNAAKFEAARSYGKSVGYYFIVVTEEFLFREYRGQA